MKTVLKLALTICLFISISNSAQMNHIFSFSQGKTYSLTFSKNDNNYDFNLSEFGLTDKVENFTLSKIDPVTFNNILFQKLTSFGVVNRDDEVNKKLNEVFYTVISNIETVDGLNYAPIAGVLTLNKDINLYTDVKRNPSKKLNGIVFHITNVQIVFQNGFIQDIIVDGIIKKNSKEIIDSKIKFEQFENGEVRFTNFYGIGFSSKKNIQNLKRINLYPNQKKQVNLTFDYDGKDLFNENFLHIKLGEVLQSYDFRNDLYTNDYSPANIKISMKAGESVTLFKDKTFRILEARIFSDFLGFDSKKPNGLIQFELEKQFNFNTTRYKFGSYKLRSGIGVMEYLKLVGGFTKIEDNNSFLIPDVEDVYTTSYLGENVIMNKRFTTPIDVINHQIWNVGLSSNIALVDMPLIKSQVHFNAGFRFAQTKIQDSLRILNSDNSIVSKVYDYNLNHWLLYPEVMLHVLPETRYGFYASWRPKYFSSLSDGLEFRGKLNNINGIRRSNVSNWINEYELLGYLFLNEEKQNGKLFIRWRLNAEMGYAKNNFSQFQVGYSFYILGRGKQ